MDTQQQQQREQQAQELKNLADGLRPAVQAVLDVVVTGAKAGLVMPGAADDVWAAGAAQRRGRDHRAGHAAGRLRALTVSVGAQW
jgi:hypothetical protein